MSLDPLTSNLGQLRAKHLLRRCLFHYNNALLSEMSNLTAADAIDQLLLDDTISYNEPYDPMPLDDPHGYWLSSGVILLIYKINQEKERCYLLGGGIV